MLLVNLNLLQFMKVFFRLSSIILLVFLLSSCATSRTDENDLRDFDSLDNGVKMDIRKFFSGDIEGSGIVQDGNGKIKKTYIVKVNGKWDDNKGVVSQNFQYSDGTKDGRTWLITMDANNIAFTAIGHEVSTPARGKQVGNSAQMSYSTSTQEKDGDKMGAVEPRFDEKMYLVDDKSMIIVSRFIKNAIDSGKIIMSLKKVSANQ